MAIIENIKSHMTDYPGICDAIVDIKLRCSFPVKLEDSDTDVSGMEICNSNPEYTVIVEVGEPITLQGNSVVDGHAMNVLRQAVYHSFPEAVYTGWIKSIEVQQHSSLMLHR